jgi:hypothetical protein
MTVHWRGGVRAQRGPGSEAEGVEPRAARGLLDTGQPLSTSEESQSRRASGMRRGPHCALMRRERRFRRFCLVKQEEDPL